MTDWAGDMLLEPDEIERLRAAEALLAPKPAAVEPVHLSPPEWGAADLTLRAAA